MYNYEKKKTFDELAQEFQYVGERNSKLPALAWACKREKLDEQQATQKMYALYDAYDMGHGRGADDIRKHHSEIDRAVARAYSGEYVPSQSPQQVKTIKADTEKLTKFHDGIDCKEWKDRIMSWLKQGTEKTNTEILWSLFRNCKSGYVAYYGDKTETCWLDIANEFEDYDGLGKYYTLCTFAEKKKRTGENMDCQAVVVIEIDHPHDWNGREWDELSEDEQKDRMGQNFSDTCRLLTELGISPTTITFSGTKSWHVAFRLSKPVPKKEMERNKSLVMQALEIIGADSSMISAARSSRIPRKCPSECKPEERRHRQHVMYWDADAEVAYDKLVERLVAVAEKINGDKILELPNIEAVCPFKFEGEGEDRKLVWISELWEPLVRELGIFKVHQRGEPRYIKQDKKGIYREMSLDEIGDYILNEIGKYDMRFKAKMREKRDVTQAKWYVGVDGVLNKLKDDKECVRIPFRDCVVSITKSGVNATSGYGGFSIPANTPTLWHNFSITDEASEFEAFLRHACGELEANPEWEKRFSAFKCLAGYLITQVKEDTNWMCVITDESLSENDGGTGKSIFMTAIYKTVETEYRDERNRTKDMIRFGDSDYSSTCRVLWRDEMPRDYDWSSSFAEATGMKNIELKGKNKRIKLTMDEIQKLCYCTNFFPSGLGNSFERRMKRYELSNHYHTTGDSPCTPYDEFGHILFTDWDSDEWNRFYNFMCGCVQFYLQCGKLIDSGIRYEAEKKENANIPEAFVQWFDEEISVPVEQLGELKINANEIGDKYREWYKERKGQYPNKTSSSQTRNQWIDTLSKNRGIAAEYKNVKDCGKAVKKWCFERLQKGSQKKADQPEADLATDEKIQKTDEVTSNQKMNGYHLATIESVDSKHIDSSGRQVTSFLDRLKENKKRANNSPASYNDTNPSENSATSNQEENKAIESFLSGSSGVSQSDPPPSANPLYALDGQWVDFNGTQICVRLLRDDFGNARQEVYCKGEIPPPIKRSDKKGALYYQLLGNWRKASGVGVVTDGCPVEFIVVD